MDSESRKSDDRISSVPQDILLNILSLLKYKFAIQTSVLSKRWKLLWWHLPRHCFEFNGANSYQHYSSFIDRALSGHVHSQSKIDSVAFKDPRIADASCRSHVKKILNYAVSDLAESLRCLSLATDFDFRPCSMPSEFWNSSVLTSLSLNGLFFDVAGDDTHSANHKSFEFFSNFVSLKYLKLQSCSIDGTKFFKIVSSQLQTLVIHNLNFRFSNDVELKVVIMAPKLSRIEVVDDYSPLKKLEMMNPSPNLKEANIGFSYFDRETDKKSSEQFAVKMFNLMFHPLRKTEVLKLDWKVVIKLSKAVRFMGRHPSPFENLRLLTFYGNDSPESLTSRDVDAVKNYFLRSSPTATIDVKFKGYGA